MLWLLFIINVTIVAIITVTMMLLVFDICSWSPTHRRPWCFKHFLAIFCFFMVFHVNLHTHVMLRYGYLGVGLGGVGQWRSCQLAHTRHATLWFFSLALAHTRHATLWLSWGGVGWGNDVHVNLHTHVMLRYCYVLLHLHTHVMLRYCYVLLHKRTPWIGKVCLGLLLANLWDHWHLTDFSKNFARPSKQWSASEKKEKSAASQKSTNFCQKTK